MADQPHSNRIRDAAVAAPRNRAGELRGLARGLDRWDNEGGARAEPMIPRGRRASSLVGEAADFQPPTLPEDTPQGCRGRAADDLARAALADSEQGRRRLERSAASWTERGAMLERQASLDRGAEGLAT
ncbi:MAG: hypothetical protein ACXWU2_07750 [Allosphingosinicella sp.]